MDLGAFLAEEVRRRELDLVVVDLVPVAGHDLDLRGGTQGDAHALRRLRLGGVDGQRHEIEIEPVVRFDAPQHAGASSDDDALAADAGYDDGLVGGGGDDVHGVGYTRVSSARTRMKPRHQKRAFVRTEVKLLPKSNLLRDIFRLMTALLRSRSVDFGKLTQKPTSRTAEKSIAQRSAPPWRIICVSR